MSRLSALGVSMLMLAMTVLTGCPCPSEELAPAPAPVVAAAPCAAPGMASAVQYLPGGKAQCAMVKVEKSAPEQVVVGQPFEYQLTVTNTSDADLEEVMVIDTLPADFKMASADPKASQVKGSTAIWDIGALEQGGMRTIRVQGTATKAAVLNNCVEVTYRVPPLCLAIAAVQPAIEVTKAAPDKVLLCDPIPLTFVVTNTGDIQVCDVVVTDELPAGLTASGGQTLLTFNAGALDPGQSREFNATVRADKTGRYVNKAVATAAMDLRAESAPTTTVVVQPELTVTKTGPEMRYIGRPVTYIITVTNGPDVQAENAVLTDTLPAGSRFVSASDDGQLQGNQVVWSLGTLAPKAGKEVSLTVVSDSLGTLENTASVQARCASASAKATTVIEGIPAILLEVIDLEDPIEVGAQETYEIAVTNQGSADDTDIVIVATLPAQEEYVTATGPTEHIVKGQVVTFTPLSVLAPKARVVYRIVIKATAAGDVRFKVSLNSKQMTKPAEETEATTLYE